MLLRVASWVLPALLALQPSDCWAKKWTVLVYMAADNDLTEYGQKDLAEMMSVGANERVDIIVELDQLGDSGVDRFHIQNGKKELLQHQAEPTEISQYERLLNFVQWGLQAYPADHTALILWGHGQGWTMGDLEGNQSFGGLAFDDSNGTFLTAADLIEVGQRVKKLDVLVADACLMQSLDVVTGFSTAAQYVLGSAQIQDYLGLPYDEILQRLATGQWSTDSRCGADDEACLFSHLVVDRVQAANLNDTYTMSAVGAGLVENLLVPELGELAQLLLQFAAEDEERWDDFRWHLESLPRFKGGTVEIGLWLSYVEEFLRDEDPVDPKLLEQVAVTHQALTESVVHWSYGVSYQQDPNYHLGSFKGLTFWFPESPFEFNARWEDFAFSYVGQRAPSWPQLLRAFWQSP